MAGLLSCAGSVVSGVSSGVVGVECGAHLVDAGAVGADGFVELLAGDAELVGPVGDVGCHFRVDLFGVVGAFDVGTLVAVVLGVVDDFGGGEDGVFGVRDDFYVAIVFFCATWRAFLFFGITC